ncbi:MAG: hypothetical protein F6K55_45140 [Moorea sp. SIO4A3]|nr:hypothetical protein [Moorena sp. SIO4A3]
MTTGFGIKWSFKHYLPTLLPDECVLVWWANGLGFEIKLPSVLVFAHPTRSECDRISAEAEAVGHATLRKRSPSG